jgi:hypothetical protein
MSESGLTVEDVLKAAQERAMCAHASTITAADVVDIILRDAAIQQQVGMMPTLQGEKGADDRGLRVGVGRLTVTDDGRIDPEPALRQCIARSRHATLAYRVSALRLLRCLLESDMGVAEALTRGTVDTTDLLRRVDDALSRQPGLG